MFQHKNYDSAAHETDRSELPRGFTVEQIDEGFDNATEQGAITETFQNGTTAVIEALQKLTDEVSPADLQKTMQSMGEEHGVKQTEDDTNTADLAAINAESLSPTVLAESAKLQQDLPAIMQEAETAEASGDTARSAALMKDMLARVDSMGGVEALPESSRALYKDIKEKIDSDDFSWKKFGWGVVDLVPFVGDVKMMGESAAGKTMGGDSLSGWQRVLHGAEGMTLFALNCVGWGEGIDVVRGGGKGAMAAYDGAKLAPKVLRRCAALLRTLAKGDRAGQLFKASEHLFTLGSFLGRHPKLAELGSKGIRSMMQARKARALEYVPSSILHSNDRPGMNLEAAV